MELRQQELRAKARPPEAIFTLLIGSVLVEVTASDRVSTVIEQLARRIGANSALVSITQEGHDLPKEATLSELAVSASSKLSCRLQGFPSVCQDADRKGSHLASGRTTWFLVGNVGMDPLKVPYNSSPIIVVPKTHSSIPY